MSSLTDETLVKRARHASTNLWTLGVMAVLAGIGLIALSASEGPIGGQTWVFGAVLGLLAGGYWVLGAAARRGDQRSVAIVVAVLVVNLLVIVAIHALNALRQRGHVSPDATSIMSGVVGLLILLILTRNYRELVELRKRGLWEGVFGSCKPSGHLCAVGGFLFVTGILGVHGSTFYIAHGAVARQAEMKQAQAFVRMIQTQEQEFLAAMNDLTASGPSPARIEAALAAADQLEQAALTLQKDVSGNETLSAILATHINSTKEYKSALTLLQQPNPDRQQVRSRFLAGDEFRRDAGARFDQEYASPQHKRLINAAQGGQ